MSGNNINAEVHGCIVCAKLFNVLVIYTSDCRMVDCTVTRPSGYRVPDERRLLFACDIHRAEVIENAYKRWQVSNVK